MSDWSYRYGRPRSEVHEARYGTRTVPPRRGLGGVRARTIGSGAALIAVGVGLAIIGILLWR